MPKRRVGPFDTEAEASVAIARMNGMEPPDDMLAQWELQLAAMRQTA